MEKYQENLQRALSNLKIADHIIYVTYPIIKDKRLLLKSLEQLYESLIFTIETILQYDYLWRRIRLTGNSKEDFKVFTNKSAKMHNITDNEMHELSDFLELVNSHKKSSMEFKRQEKIIILSDNLKTSSLDIEKLKYYLNFSKRIIEKVIPTLR